jgi:putative hydrolase of the HAD superfamily
MWQCNTKQKSNNKVMAIEHIFWDLDHTLWDFETNSVSTLRQLYQEADLANKGVADFDEFNKVYHAINDKMWERFRKGFITREVMRWKRMHLTMLEYKIIDEALAKFLGERYLEILPEQTNLFEGAIEVLSHFKERHIKQHIITNGFENTQIQKMTNSKILHYFDEIICSEKAMAMKPNKEIYEFALAQTGATIFNSVMIGDAIEVDIRGALGIDMPAIWFNPHRVPRTEATTYEVHQLQEITSIKLLQNNIA